MELRKTVSVLEVTFQSTFSQFLAFSIEYKGLNANGCGSVTLYSKVSGIL